MKINPVSFIKNLVDFNLSTMQTNCVSRATCTMPIWRSGRHPSKPKRGLTRGRHN